MIDYEAAIAKQKERVWEVYGENDDVVDATLDALVALVRAVGAATGTLELKHDCPDCKAEADRLAQEVE